MTNALRRFECCDGTSSKFWEIGTDGKNLTVRFGKIGTAGTVQTKSFATADACAREAEKLVREKTKKGYAEPTAMTPAPVVAAPRGKASSAKAAKSAPGALPNDGLAATFRAILDIAAMNEPAVEIPPPATAEQIAALEAALGFATPAPLRAMLEVSNGPTVALFGDEGALLSVERLIEKTAFCNGAVQASPDQRLVPFAVDNGVFAFVVETPGDKRRGEVATWDPDGESYGDYRKPIAKSLDELLAKRHGKLLKALPKGMPVVPGFAFGRLPERDTLDQIIAALKKTRGAIDVQLGAFSRNRAMLRAVVESLLEGGEFLAYEDHDEILASLADEIDIDVVLRAFRTRKLKEKSEYGLRYLDGWTIHLDNLMTTLIARDAGRVEAAHPTFARSIADGYALVRRRLGQIPLEAIPPELRQRIALEARTPPNSVRIIPASREESGTTRDVACPADVTLFDFALAPFFEDMIEHARYVLDHVLRLQNATIGGWMAGPCLRIATVPEAVQVFSKIYDLRHGDVLWGARVARRPMSALLVDVSRAMPDSTPIRARQAIAWAAYVSAANEGTALPELDGVLVGFNDVVDADRFCNQFGATLRKLGPARVAAIFTRHPAIAERVAALS